MISRSLIILRTLKIKPPIQEGVGGGGRVEGTPSS